jgi:lipopolysaccharide export system protein LptA
MSISIPRLRRWFAGGAIFVCLAVLGTFFYLKHRVQNALKQVPGKIGVEIQQSAQGFTISKSDQGRTLFKLQASKAIQFKQGGRVDLHDVTITVYGRDSSRFDQIYGQTFEYDQQSGNVTSTGEVSIDLQANPQGILHPDQTPPKELKNPLHLTTTALVFNQKTGDAWTSERVDFRVPQASGSAVGARYVANQGVLNLQSQVRIEVNGESPSTITAERAELQKAPREIVLWQARGESSMQRGQADHATLFLKNDNTLDHLLADGDVQMDSSGEGAPMHIRAEKLEVNTGSRNAVQMAMLSGAVQLRTEDTQPMEARAGRAELMFSGHKTLSKIHAEQQVTLLQRAKPDDKAGQDVQVTAPAMDFVVVGGKRLSRVETIGAPEILLAGNDKQGETRVTADKFTATFDSAGQLSQVRGGASVRVVSNSTAGSKEQTSEHVSTSDSITAQFRPGVGITSLVQAGHFTYTSGTQRAFADQGSYKPADQTMDLTGSPRIIDSGMETTARSIRLNRATGVGSAIGDVKTSYSDLKAQPGGALLASSDPIHVTAESMTAHNSSTTATYTGNARLWQNANVIEAPSIQFQKDQRMLIADSKGDQKVSTVLAGTDKQGKATPVAVTSNHLVYRDADPKAHFEGGVKVRGADLTITANQMDVLLQPSAISHQPSGKSEPGASLSSDGLSKLDKIIASGSVVITEPNRHATGNQLTYTASDDKFVLTGGPPSIFDAEHGKITGVSLTLYRRDDRVVVEGSSSSPAITQTRVVR